MRWKILLVLLILLLAYVFIGGAVFYGLESFQEEDLQTDIRQYTTEFLDAHKCVSNDDYRSLIRKILEAYDAGVLNVNGTQPDTNWDYASSTFFATTVITTIGYGHIAPQTSGGQAFCIVYALAGIPLVLVVLAGIGEKINSLSSKLENRLKLCSTRPRLAKVLRTSLTMLVGITLFIIIPAIGFSVMDEWSYGTSIYYGVITLTTIGFGDYVASAPQVEHMTARAFYRFAVCIWIIFGLSWVAGIISSLQSLMQSGIEKGVEKGGEKLGLASQQEQTSEEEDNLSQRKSELQSISGLMSSTSKVSPAKYGGL